MEFSEVVRQRRSIKSYDRDQAVSDAQLRAIFEDVVLSPSSFNLQHWTFIVVRDPALKKALRAAAWDQAQVEDAAAAILVCGRLDAHKDARRIYGDAPVELREQLVPMIREFYEGREQAQRDEAIRSGALAAMALMLAARNHGLDTGPMIGFDPEAVSALLGLTPNYIPVMMVVMGRRSGEPRPRAYRRPLDEVVRLERLDGRGLSSGDKPDR